MKNKNSGLTLIELIIAVAVLAVLMLGLFAAMSTSMYTAARSKHSAEMQKLAQQVMEELLSLNYGNLQAQDGKVILEGKYTVSISVHDFAVYVKQLTVVITLPESKVPPFTLSTLKSRSG
mgnify:CR=1 FL=1